MTNGKFGLRQLTDVIDSVRRNGILVLAVFAVLLFAAIAYVRFVPREYQAGANVLVVNGNTRDDPTLGSPDLPSIATSTVVLERVRKNLGLDLSLKDMKKRLTAKPPPFKSSILRIAFVDTDDARAALIANGVADELVSYYREISTARYDADLSALNAELTDQSNHIRKIDRRLSSAGTLADSADSAEGSSDSNGTTYALQIASLERDRELSSATLQGDVAALDSVRLNARTRSEIARRDVLQNDPLYQSLLAGSSTEAAALAKERAMYRSSYPGLPALETKVDSMSAATVAEARRALAGPHAFSPSLAAADAEERKAAATVEADRARVGAFDDLIAREQDRVSTLAPLALLRLERSAAKQNYLSISSRLATALANRADALSLGSVVVVDRAIAAETQIGFGVHTLLAILVMLIIAISIGSALLADVLNPRLRRVAQIEALYGHPVIATIGGPK